MTRQIVCRKCGVGSLHAEDVARGWQQRVSFIAIPTPPKGQPPLLCDHCGCRLGGEIVLAVTRWTKRESEQSHPGFWESHYGTILPGDSVVMSDALLKD